VSNHPQQIADAARGKLPEQILGAAFGKPRGSTMAVAGGGIVGAIGGQWAGRQNQGAAAAGIQLGNPGAVAVTPTSLVTMQVGVTPLGKIKEVRQILSVVPLAHVDSLEVRRMGMVGVLEISVAGSTFKLEGKVPDMRQLAEAFHRAKGVAPRA
jgi:hypothetical protein